MTVGPRRWRGLRHHALQSGLTIAALSAAVALPVILLSVGGGVVTHEIERLQRSGYQVTVSAAGLHGVEGAHALTDRIDALSEVHAASPVLSASLVAFPPHGGPSPVLAEGVIPSAFGPTLGPDESGLFPSPLPFSDPADARHFANGSYAGPPDLQVMASAPFLTEFGLAVGGSLSLAPTDNRSSSVTFTIVGSFGAVAASIGPTAAFALVVPLSTLQQLTGYARSAGPNSQLIDAADTIQVALVGGASTDPSAVDRVAGQVQALAPYYGVEALTDQASQLRASSQVLTGFYLALSSVALSVGLVFLTLVLLRRVDTERREIGIRRALGVPGLQVAASWVRTSAVLAGSGIVGGLVGGFLTVTILARYGAGAVATAAQLAVFDGATLGLLSAGILALSTVAGLGATWAALRLPISEALR